MIVTPRDVVIADYAVRSYARIKDVDFSLLVYSNYLLPEQKAYYFPRWEAFEFVDIARNTCNISLPALRKMLEQKLPDERAGTLLIFKSFDRISYGLVVGAANIIHVQDVVHNP